MGKKKKGKKNTQPPALTPEGLSRSAREIWLAGLGALDRARKDGGEAFDGFVKRGEKLRKGAGDVVDVVLDKLDDAGDAVADTAKASGKKALAVAEDATGAVEKTVTAVLGKLGVPGRKEVASLTKQVASLQKRLEKMQDGGASAPKSAPKKSAPSKAKAKTAAVIYRVVPREKGWAVERDGASQASSLHGTKKEALVAGRKLARDNAPSRLTIHRADGSEQETSDYEAA